MHKDNFKSLATYKAKILTAITNDQNLMKAVKYGQKNFESQPDIEDFGELIGKLIYPFPFIPDTEQEKHTFLTFNLADYRPQPNTVQFKTGIIRFDCFCHHTLSFTDYDMLRLDYIINRIDEMMNQKRGLGIGKIEFMGMNSAPVNSDYYGQYITYKIWEIQ